MKHKTLRLMKRKERVKWFMLTGMNDLKGAAQEQKEGMKLVITLFSLNYRRKVSRNTRWREAVRARNQLCGRGKDRW